MLLWSPHTSLYHTTVNATFGVLVTRDTQTELKAGNGPRRPLPRPPSSPFAPSAPSASPCTLPGPPLCARSSLTRSSSLILSSSLIRSSSSQNSQLAAQLDLPQHVAGCHGAGRVWGGTRWVHMQGGRKHAAGATGLGARCPSPLQALGLCCHPQCQFPAAARARGGQPRTHAPCPGGR